MSNLKVIGKIESINDVSRCLRTLADQIDRGDYGDAHNVAWIVDCGCDQIEVGMAGPTASSGAEAHYLMAKGMRKLELL
jgi:hypothetical protein